MANFFVKFMNIQVKWYICYNNGNKGRTLIKPHQPYKRVN